MADFLYLVFIYPIELLIETVFLFTDRLFDNYGLSIAAVSLAVSFLSLPLYIIAERWQQKERDIQTRFKPEIDEIKAVFKGDERYMILTTFYRQNRYHPVMALRSSISLMIQVPFFIAAYSFLSNLEMLKGAEFWIFRDLGSPDRLFTIGSFPINILPIAMTLINIVASAVYVKGFMLKEKMQLYGMAALFLVLLYNSPAGLVLYWTLNNVFSLFKNICYKIRLPEMPAAAAALREKAGNILSKPLNPLLENDRNRLGLFMLVCSAFLLLVGIVIPTSLVSSSVAEFSFIEPYDNPLSLVKFPFFQTLGITAWLVAIYFLFSKKVQSAMAFLMVFAVVWSLVNTYAFPGNYGTVLVGNGIEFESGLKIKNELAKFPVDMAVFAALAAILVPMFCLRKDKFVKAVFSVLVLSLTAFSGYNIFKINSEFHRLEAIVASGENSRNEDLLKPVFHFSRTGKNVIVMMLDRGISTFVPEIFRERPDVARQFEGFTYFPNTVSPSSCTILCAPALFGGYEYLPENSNKRTDQTLREKHNESLKMLPAYFGSKDFDITVTDAPLANFSWIPDNSIFDDDINAFNLSGRYEKLWRKEHGMELEGFVLSDFIKRDFLFFNFFRISPVCLRGIIYDHGDWWSSDESKGRDENSVLINWYSALDYICELSDIEGEGSAYFAIDNDTTHEPAYLQYPDYTLQREITDRGENNIGGEYVFRHYHVNAATFRMLGKWMDWMRENGVWDNTRIIIASDHGRFFRQENKALEAEGDPDLINAYSSLLLFKDFGSEGPCRTDRTFMTVADVPVLAVSGFEEKPLNPFTGKPLDSSGKKNGILVGTGPVEANEHNRNTYRFTPVYRVNRDIYKAGNWEKLND